MIDNNNPLFSVIVLCYRHFEYLYSAIDSVLMQDYPNIELIVSDDGSDNFPYKKITDYIENNKRSNISSFTVWQEESNCGTVKHLNHSISKCKGEYIVALAGDDNFFDETALYSYVQGFNSAPENCYIEMAQTAMCDEKLETINDYYLKPMIQKALIQTEHDTSELLKMLIKYGACLPSTSTCFRKQFFEKFGKFDESYILVEDYPMHFRLAQEGWIIHWCNFVAIKHRNGGISHGQSDTLSRSAKLYFNDEKRMIEEIVIKNASLLGKDEKKKLIVRMKKNLLWLNKELSKGDVTQKVSIGIRHPFISLQYLMEKAWPWAYERNKKSMYAYLIIWLVMPTVSQMFDYLIPGSGQYMLCALAILAGIIFAVWAVSIVIWIYNKISWSIRRFPKESLAIG